MSKIPTINETSIESNPMTAPKRGFFFFFFPLLLLLSLSILFLFSSLHTSSLPNFHHPQTPPNINHFQRSPNSSHPNFTLTIKLLAYDRLPSLSRCLRSLAAAHYVPGDKVNLHIFIDHFKTLDNDNSTDLDLKLNRTIELLDFVDGFLWVFGEKLVHYRTVNVGLQGQWLESWWPESDDDFAFVVEDDLEVSPLYYRFIRGIIVNYYYNESNFSPWIYGASLQRPRFVPGKHGNKMQLDKEKHLFLYQLVGTWGQLLFPRPWREFRFWYDAHKVKGIKPFLQGMVTTGWYKKMGERIWTPWFIKFIHSRSYFNIYTNFLHERALSVSHRDTGVNYAKTAGPDSSLLDESSLDSNHLLKMLPLSNLKWYDFCFREVLPDRVVSSANELGPVLHSVQNLNTILLVSLHEASEAVTNNLLCHFERLNIRNYIFVGQTSILLLDLARRGHPVIDVDKFFDSMGAADKSMRFQEPNLELIKEMLVKAHVIKKSLEYGYSTWVSDLDMLPLTGNSFLDPVDPTSDFYIGSSSLKLLFIRKSTSTLKIWTDEFISKIPLMVDSQMNGRNIVGIVGKLLELSKQKGVKVKRLEDIIYGVKVDASSVNETLVRDGKKMVFWSSSDLGSNLVEEKLGELGMWIIDGDHSCTAVTCHQS